MSRRSNKPIELNLLPVMNLVTLLIPLLLMSAQMVQLSVIDVGSPAMRRDAPVEPEPPTDRLHVVIDTQGVWLTGLQLPSARHPASFLCQDAPCGSPEAYPLRDLNAHLSELKTAHPDRSDAVITPSANLPFEIVMAVLDTLRKSDGDDPQELFPAVVFAGGA